ncbi:MAG: hypothetical protein WC817_01385 [Patescibacteria group bacterium]|jgi:phosphoribosylaminoimidazolecarboxamide formyltransferase/IMP cyclohydrolase
MVLTALLSVWDQTGLPDFARGLVGQGMKIISTGGTAQALRDARLKVVEVSDVTGFPEILDGRVKTLHPKIFGGILARRDDEAHWAQMDCHGITEIDLVCVNPYPFADVVAEGAPFSKCIENIDIDGVALLRAAAKNYADVVVVSSPRDYERVLEELRRPSGISLELREELAWRAFRLTSDYDAAVAEYLANHRSAR